MRAYVRRVTTPGTSARVTSIDLLRGIVMVIMALDHVRDYFHVGVHYFDPTDMGATTVPVFLTRWITHYCAPVFVFLAGTSAWTIGERKGGAYLSAFLLKRGLWLILIEVVLITFAWQFNPRYPRVGLQVIWAIGVSMVALAGLARLPMRAIAIIGLALVFGHNALDGIHFDGAWWWKALHERGFITLGDRRVMFAYPVIPWIGTMALGYCFGAFYGKSVTADARRRALIRIGAGAIALFVLLRFINVYGDPDPWSSQPAWSHTLLSFLNVHKYPPSLLYLLMTLGPAILFLAFSEKLRGRLASALMVFGRVPFFYYVLHLYLIHLGAMLAAQLTGFGWQVMVLDEPVFMASGLKGYGFSLPVTYVIWAGMVLALYPLCKWYDRVKTNNRHRWWLSYL